MSFIKQFEITKDKELVLINIQECNDYIQRKVEYFRKNNNFNSKDKMIGLIEEILEMYSNDLETAIFDTSQIIDIQLFEINDHKKKILIYYNVVYILGIIYLNVFNSAGNRFIKAKDGTNGPISTAQMFESARDELLICAERGKIPFGANLIFTTLLEKDLKGTVKILCAQDWLMQLQDNIKKEVCILTQNEEELFIFLCNNYGLSTKTGNIKFEGVSATTSAFYDLLIKYQIVEENDTEVKKIICDRFTLTPFLKSQICEDKIEEPYRKLLILLFDYTGLNLRNNLAHCNYGILNYHTINVSSLLYILFSMISTQQCVKGT